MRRDDPKYRVRTVSRLTGVAPPTLRAWEKRYGVPVPARTETHYRLYSEADVDQIRWMKAQIEEGIPPARAAELTLERSLPPVEQGEIGEPPLPSPVSTRDSSADAAAVDLKARLKAAFQDFDENRVREIVREAASVLPPLGIMRDILLPAVAEMGDEWEAGRVTVAQEHFASQYARSFADRLLDVYPQRRDAASLVLACAPGEFHELGLLALAVELRSRSIPILYLGADVPVRDVLDTVEATRAAGAVVALTIRERIESWAHAGAQLRRTLSGTRARILWAGPGAEAAAISNLPGDIALTVEDAVDTCLVFVRPRALGHTDGDHPREPDDGSSPPRQTGTADLRHPDPSPAGGTRSRNRP
jgi:DNA-binding transcriptional MerR regulator